MKHKTKESPPAAVAGKSGSRRDMVITAALTVLAQHGSRGFTHREIDRHLGWPLGSTSNYFRRRSDLLAAVGARIMDLDLDDSTLILRNLSGDVPVTIERAVDLFIQLIERWMQPDNHDRALARLEIIVERIRNSDLRVATEKQLALAQLRYQAIFEKLMANDPSAAARIFSRLLISMHLIISDDSVPPDRLLLQTLLRDWLTVSINAMADAS